MYPGCLLCDRQRAGVAIPQHQEAHTETLWHSAAHRSESPKYLQYDSVQVNVLQERYWPGEIACAATGRGPSSRACVAPIQTRYSRRTRLAGGQSATGYVFPVRRAHALLHGSWGSAGHALVTSAAAVLRASLRQPPDDHRGHRLRAFNYPESIPLPVKSQCPRISHAIRAATAIQPPITTPNAATSNQRPHSICSLTQVK